MLNILVLMLLLAGIIGNTYLAWDCYKSFSKTETTPITTTHNEPTRTTITTPTTTPTTTVPVIKYPTTYRVTAYCSCDICCGDWAENRPLDKNGKEIVYGASGDRLVSGVSVASTLPLGTVVDLEGYGRVIVQDRMASWVIKKYGVDVIDIYFDSHQKAKVWGARKMNGRIVE